jgi:hypothetical protein
MEFEIKDTVTIDDRLSLNDECTGTVAEITHEGIYKVVFCDGSFSYHEPIYLIK